MKKTIYGLLVLCAACFAFTSCGDDDDNNLGTHSEQPGAASAGIYTGTWTEYNSKGEPTKNVDLPGTVEIINSGAYTATLRAACTPAIWLLDGEQQVNCVWANDIVKYANNILNGTFGSDAPNSNIILQSSTVDGTCDNGVMTLNIQRGYKQGRPTYTYIYKFTGKKQN